MKKCAYPNEWPRRLLKKLLFMKLCLALILATASQVAAHTGYSQGSVSLQLENARLSTILKTIQKRTDYRFVFSNKLVDETGMVNIKVQNTPVLSLLPTILNGTGLEYQQMSDNLIVIREKVAIKKNILVKGVVTNSKGEPVAGATVSSNKGKATITNDKGAYSIEVDEFDELTFSYVGYGTQVIKVNGQQTLNVVFEEANRALEEVVVTALGITREAKALGYAVQKVNGNQIQTVKGVDAATSLTGKISGLVIKNSTEFNASPTIELRGETPLLVIDGVPYNNMTLRDIPSDNIDDISVLKGATATALYGSRGQGGAIMITTKKGKGGGLSVDINSNTMVASGFLAIPKIQTSYGHGLDGKIATDYVWGPKLDIGDSAVQWNPVTKREEMMPLVSSGKNNLRNFLQTGLITNNNITVTQNGENGFFRAGVNHIYNKGQFPNEKLNIVNYTMSGALKIGKKFSVESSMGYTWEQSPQIWGQGYGAQGYIYQLQMWTGPDYDVRQYRDYWVTPNLKQNWLYTEWYDNPYMIAYEKLDGIQKNKLNASLTANYKFTNNLKLMFRTGYDFYKNEETVQSPAGIYSTRGGSSPTIGSTGIKSTFSWNYGGKGMFGMNQMWGFSTNNDLILTYDKKIGNFDINLLGGGSIVYNIDREQGAQTVNGLAIPGWYSLANAVASTAVGVDKIKSTYGTWRKQMNSLYGKASISWNRIAYLDITGRNDWASTQPAAQQSFFYPSLAGSVILSQFIKMPQAVDMWKVRGAWTQAKTPAGIYDYNRNYNPSTSWGMPSTSYPSTILSTSLFASATKTWEVGTEAYFLKGRLHVDLAYFNKYYYQQQYKPKISQASGSDEVLLNIEETYVRKGIEVTVDGAVIKRKNFEWHSLVNYSFNHNYYRDLDPVYTPDKLWIKKGARKDVYVSQPLLRDPQGNLILVGGLVASSPYEANMGYTDPKFSFGFVNNFAINNFIVGISIDGRIGGIMYDYIWNKMFDSGTNPETDTKWRYDQVVNGLTNYVGEGVKLVSGEATYDKYGRILTDTRKFEKNDVAVGYQAFMQELNNTDSYEHGLKSQSFVKLREISVGYKIPSRLYSKSGIKNASVSLTAQNVFLWTKFTFSDPDLGNENLNAPSQRMLGLNIKLGL
ncbi:TonB-linked outer membrane protein, SusC/RagA family [Niabella drilacis]|uniref:TonB-linked outer membrane protein, SusC/RagA family n=2 Tax=Niabella drilacis (strain DSM 25811 / CCM 8410 / CCUG 62505 / LMG 26954 / E90) TaxID=1285928 RepID=A0A1G6YJX3_NIADE|nr:TonB-linked outer membrane protein, SusC/RagA family [Niabella drilacis]